MIDKDPILIETAQTRRTRLLASLVFGPIAERRRVTSNVGRFIASAVVAAVICLVCLGFSFVTYQLQKTELDKTRTNYAAAVHNLRKVDPNATVDESTGYPIDKATGWVRGPYGRFYDRQTGWEIDTATGYLIDPSTNLRVDPKTGQPVAKGKH